MGLFIFFCVIFCYVSATIDGVMPDGGTVENEVSQARDTAANGPQDVNQSLSGTPPVTEKATHTSSTPL